MMWTAMPIAGERLRIHVAARAGAEEDDVGAGRRSGARSRSGSAVWSMTAISAPASAAGSAAGEMSGWPNDELRPGRVAAESLGDRAQRGIGVDEGGAHRRPQARGGGGASSAIASPRRIGAARLPQRVEARGRALGEQQHDRRAEHEAAHLLALLQRHAAGGVGPFAHAAACAARSTVPCQTVAMLPTMVAPTSASTKRPTRRRTRTRRRRARCARTGPARRAPSSG